MLAFAVGLTRTWVALYTRGLPGDLRAARREEIHYDLWEQQRLGELDRQPVTATAAQVIFRLLLGIPDDISWRIEAGADVRPGKKVQVNESVMMKGLLLLAVAVAAFPLVIGVLVVIGANGEMSSTERVLFGPLQIAVGTVILAGLLMSGRRPALGIGLVAAGVLAISVMWYWAAMITIPVGLVLLAIAYLRGHRTVSGTSGPTGTV